MFDNESVAGDPAKFDPDTVDCRALGAIAAGNEASPAALPPRPQPGQPAARLRAHPARRSGPADAFARARARFSSNVGPARPPPPLPLSRCVCVCADGLARAEAYGALVAACQVEIVDDAAALSAQEVFDTPLLPTPHTLHPTPYTLHPTPYTQHPTPYTLHPTPCTLRSTPPFALSACWR